MPQLVPFFFFNQIVLVFLIILLICVSYKYVLPKIMDRNIFKIHYFPIIKILIIAFMIRFSVIWLLQIYDIYYIYVYLIGLISIGTYVFICKFRNCEWSWKGIILAWFFSTSVMAIIFYIRGIDLGFVPYLKYIDIFNILPTIQEYDKFMRNCVNLFLNVMLYDYFSENLEFFIPIGGALTAHHFDSKFVLNTVLSMVDSSNPEQANPATGQVPSNHPSNEKQPSNGKVSSSSSSSDHSNSTVDLYREIPEMITHGRYTYETLYVDNRPDAPRHASDPEMIRLRNQVRTTATAPVPEGGSREESDARFADSVWALKLHVMFNYNMVPDSDKVSVHSSDLTPTSSQGLTETSQNNEGQRSIEDLLQQRSVPMTHQEQRERFQSWLSQVENIFDNTSHKRGRSSSPEASSSKRIKD